MAQIECLTHCTLGQLNLIARFSLGINFLFVARTWQTVSCAFCSVNHVLKNLESWGKLEFGQIAWKLRSPSNRTCSSVSKRFDAHSFNENSNSSIARQDKKANALFIPELQWAEQKCFFLCCVFATFARVCFSTFQIPWRLVNSTQNSIQPNWLPNPSRFAYCMRQIVDWKAPRCGKQHLRKLK